MNTVDAVVCPMGLYLVLSCSSRDFASDSIVFFMHAECLTAIFIILLLCVVFKLELVKHGKASLPKNRSQMSVMSPKAQYTYNLWQIIKIQ